MRCGLRGEVMWPGRRYTCSLLEAVRISFHSVRAGLAVGERSPTVVLRTLSGAVRNGLLYLVASDGLRASMLAVWVLIGVLAASRADAQVTLKERSVLRAKRVLTVPFGRTLYLDPREDLRIEVRPGDRCTVTVLQTDALSQRPGKFTPSLFPCRFGRNQVSYTHFGAHNPKEDYIQMQIRYDSDSETVIIPFTVHVEVSFKQLQVVTRNMPLSVKKLLGLSQPISDREIDFTFDRETQVCKLTVLSPASGLPQYGRIVNDTNDLSMVDCDEFLKMGVRYQHTALSKSPRKDFIPMVVELLDRDGVALKQEYFQLMVRIKAGKKNTGPKILIDSLLLVDVDQFVMTAITPTIISAGDEETSDGNLIFNITEPLKDGEGTIVSTNDRELPLRSFYQRDVQDLKIAYKPPAADSDVRRVVQVELQAVDSEGATSKPVNLLIVVKPMQTLAPVVTRNTGIQLFEGQFRPLFSSQNLEISDEDNLEDVRIEPVVGLRHGVLTVDGALQKFFTAADLDEGRVVYQHDGSDTHSDNIIFRMTDGQHEVQFLFPITVYPEDDEPPVLIINTGLEIRKHELAAITPFVLSASDIDSEDLSTRYVLQPPFSQEGFILKRQFQIPRDKENWQQRDGAFEQVVREFTQQDIVDGKIFYRHVGSHRSDFLMDRIKFHLEDNGEPPNLSKVHEFIIKIQPVDDQPPYLHPKSLLHMNVNEFDRKDLKKKFLRYTDIDSDDRQIRYTIVAPPFDTDLNTHLSAGKIVLCHSPEVEISNFNQAQVNHHKVCYQPPDKELGISSRIIQFIFQVTDTSGNALTDQTFTINLRPINNKPPRVINSGFTVQENGLMVLSPQVLDVEDPDTDLKDIRFILTKEPKHGVLQRIKEPLLFGHEFRKSDIDDSLITYLNTGEEMESDEFDLEITDGLHNVPATVKINIESIDDETPKMISVGNGILATMLEVEEQGFVTITAENLKASDPDSDDLMLTFILDSQPHHGVLLKNGRLARNFTQGDILHKIVQYRHTGGEISTDVQNDTFSLILTDMSDDLVVGGNKIKHINVGVTIVPVDNVPPHVIIGGGFEVFENDKAPILPVYLDVQDVDTNDEDVVCTVMVQPTYGYLENISPAPGSEKSRAGMPVSAFSVRDIRLSHVNFVQSVHEGVEERADSFSVSCSDGINFSPDHVFHVRILPANDEKPVVSMREFVVAEGMLLTIDLPILNAVDKDVPPDNLTFVVTEQPRHGIVVKQLSSGTVPISAFNLDDISGESTILYEHDDSETTEDSFDFILTDGKHNVTKSVTIMVIPVDDETPRLTTNNGIEIKNMGETKLITNSELKAEDLDSEDEAIKYLIRRLPKYGYLQKTVNGLTKNLTAGSNFTQLDIDQGHIQYSHLGREGVRDLIKFDVTDGLNPLIDRYFYVTVDGIDMLYPEVINKGVELPEGGMVILTSDLLSGTDLNSPDQNLQFMITRTPTRGHLELTDQPGVPITKFTQLDLAGSKVKYIHTSEDEMKMDSFEFEVTDGYNPVARTFRISLSDVDNRKPVLMLSVLRVKEGSNRLITPFELKAEDRDTRDKLIEFTITQVPVHGNILYNYSRIVTRFTQADLNNNLISYQHDGTETSKDSFSFTVMDGTHTDFYVFPDTTFPLRYPQTMNIEIVPVDNGIPQISVNKGATYLSSLEDGKLGFVLSNKLLESKDRDSPNEDLIYVLTVSPKNGYMLNTALGNTSITNWTQVDINERCIQYILNPKSNATSDSFFFKIIDKGGNTLGNQPFHLNWAWISLESDKFIVNETKQAFEATLHRRGYLGETCFISITVENGTAKVGEDIQSRYAQQVQFNPGQTEKTWRINLLDDGKFEDGERFFLKLSDPVMAVIEQPSNAKVIIRDMEDESSVFFPKDLYEVEETVGKLSLPVHRTGDISNELMVICSTVSGSASGTMSHTVTSFSDFITRPEDYRNTIKFGENESEKSCELTIIDDSLYEDVEKFKVVLSQPMGGHVGHFNSTTVVIKVDKDDEPVVYFGSDVYEVDESKGFVEVKIWRVGTDLSKASSITVRSKRTSPLEAEAGLDYIAVNKILDFAPGVGMQVLKVNILDDLGRPQVEGGEAFELVLRMPIGAVLGEPSISTIVINDTISDVPTMQFKDNEYVAFENDGRVTAYIVRSGDLSQISMVRCYTRQGTAQVMMDFGERTNTNDSVVIFYPGEREKPCVVDLMGDNIFEVEEQFRLVLGSPSSPTLGMAAVGERDSTNIKIRDIGDKSVIKFEDSKYFVKEPFDDGELATVRIVVVRYGDLSATSIVRVHTKDGSAKAGRDYNGLSKELVFGLNVSRLIVKIEVLHDNDREMRESFTVHLKPDKNMVAEVKRNSKAIVYIEERKELADVTFPTNPKVVSLKDYDNGGNSVEMPVQGYPVICITPCNPKYPDYYKTGGLCEKEGINDTLTRFRWRVSAPSGTDGVTSQLSNVESNTFFTSTKGIVLDSIYFGPGSRVQCGARAVNVDGDSGLELLSNVATISRVEGLCMPRHMDSVGAEAFKAKLRYTGPDDPDHPNKVRVSVAIPHRDGMLPVLSTRQLSNFELILSPDGTRVGQHRCSNLLDFNEVQTEFGFITNQTKNPNVIGEVEPYQYRGDLRGDSALRFYRNLDLEACLWEFVGYYDMSELVTDCGGEITTDGQVLNLKQSYVSMRVPLYISYVFHSPVGLGGWQHFDMVSQLRLTFVYDTAILWQNGVSAPEEASLQGYLYPTSMRIMDDGRLAVDFRTEARFRGKFVPSHPGTQIESMVMSPDHSDLVFDLELVQSEPSYEQPEQMWRFVSEYAIRDYSGMYNIKLIPCTTTIDQEYTIPIICNPREPTTFELPIRFQQVSDPVATKFSLNTDFHLLRKRDLWLSDGSMGFGDNSDAAFIRGDKILGRINVDPLQSLGNSFFLSIEKVFLCSGKDGYIPKYNPDNQEFGCVAQSPNLQYIFKILDKGAPHTAVKSFRDVPFNATLAANDITALPLVRQPGADGFSCETLPLFKVDSGRQWFLHAIYTIRSKENAQRGIGKRSAEYHSFMNHKRPRRADEGMDDMGKSGKGTNMALISLDYIAKPPKVTVDVGTSETPNKSIPLIPILIAAAALLLLSLIVVLILIHRRKKSSSPPPSPTNTITIVSSNRKSHVVSASQSNNDPDKTEV